MFVLGSAGLKSRGVTQVLRLTNATVVPALLVLIDLTYFVPATIYNYSSMSKPSDIQVCTNVGEFTKEKIMEAVNAKYHFLGPDGQIHLSGRHSRDASRGRHSQDSAGGKGGTTPDAPVNDAKDTNA